MHTRTCIFCGDNQYATFRRVPKSILLDIVEKQKNAKMNDHICIFFANLIQSILQVNEAMQVEIPQEELVVQDDEEENETDNCFFACLCCWHWISRRLSWPITLLPMQSLYFFLTTVSSIENKKIDSRILSRLMCTLTNENNVYRNLFSDRQLLFFSSFYADRGHVSDQVFQHKIKLIMAQIYYERNGQSIFFCDNYVGEFLRKSSNLHAVERMIAQTSSDVQNLQ